MSSLQLIFMMLGIAGILISTILTLVAAFRTHIGWGIACLLLPFAALVFLIGHWNVAKNPFFLRLVSAVMLGGVIISSPQAREGIAKAIHTPYLTSHSAPESKKVELTAKINEQRDHLCQLQEQLAQANTAVNQQYTTLLAERKTLNTTDAAAIHAFNQTAVAYQKQNDSLKQLQQNIDETTQEIDSLLAERSKESTDAAKRVVIYTTSWCPACKAAKQYMAQKGIEYTEIDVEQSSEGREEFERLGGHGVLLIRVGEKQMEGFNSAALDAML